MEKRIVLVEKKVSSYSISESEAMYYIAESLDEALSIIESRLESLEDTYESVEQEDYDEFLDCPEYMEDQGSIDRTLVDIEGHKYYWSIEWGVASDHPLY